LLLSSLLLLNCLIRFLQYLPLTPLIILRSLTNSNFNKIFEKIFKAEEEITQGQGPSRPLDSAVNSAVHSAVSAEVHSAVHSPVHSTVHSPVHSALHSTVQSADQVIFAKIGPPF